MNKIILMLALAGASGLAMAQDMGKVLSSTAIITQVAVPRQVCTTQSVAVQPQKSGAGAVMGAVAGGAIGNSIGGGDGRAIATMLGLVGGALLGDKIEGAPAPQTQNVQSCTTQTFYENRTTGYNVVYEYAGKQYQVQMPNDPGPFVQLQIAPMAPVSPVAPAPQTPAPVSSNPSWVQPYAAPTVVTQQIITQPMLVAAAPVTYMAYPGAYARPYYPPIGLNLNFGWTNGHGGHGGHGGHHHWR
jgi:uncharacterized protein YcfJ